MAITTSLITEDADLVALRSEWDALWKISSALPFAHFDWVWMAWQRRKLYAAQGPVVGIVRDNGRLVVAAPLLRRREFLLFRRLEGLRTLLPQYSDVLVASDGDPGQWTEALMAELGHHGGARNLYFELLASTSPMAKALAPRAQLNRIALETTGADLSGGFEPYFASFSRSARWEYRRKLRSMEEAGGIELTVSTPESLREDLGWMMQTKRAQKRPRGQRLRPWMRSRACENDLGAICLKWIGTEMMWLPTLRIGGKRAAAGLAFAGGGQAIGYVIAFDPAFGEHSPGRMLALMMIEHAAKTGLTRFDFMAGRSEWKDRLSTAPLPLLEISARLPRG